jgi:hypothetical protein
MNTEILFAASKGTIQEHIDKSYSNIVLESETRKAPRKRYRITEDQFNRLIKNLLNEYESNLNTHNILTISVD